MLSRAGYQPRICSLINTEIITNDSDIFELGGYQAFIFVSSAAVRFATGLVPLLQNIEAPEIYAVGPETSRALEKFGLTSVVPSNADSEGLLELPGLNDVYGKRIAVVCGRGGRKKLHKKLDSRGAVVTRIEVYQRRQKLVELDMAGIDAVAISSGEGLLAYVNAGKNQTRDIPILLPSERVAKLARSAGFTQCIVCNGASAGAVVEGLERLFLDAI